jgi:hypothetical protein
MVLPFTLYLGVIGRRATTLIPGSQAPLHQVQSMQKVYIWLPSCRETSYIEMVFGWTDELNSLKLRCSNGLFGLLHAW